MFSRLKLKYEVYNFFHKNQLEHNIKPYEILGLKKKYYSSISGKDFKNVDEGKLSGLFPMVKSIEETAFYKETDEAVRKHIRDYDKNGYIIFPHYLSPETVDKINAEVESGIDRNQLRFKNNGRKIMFAYRQISLLKEIGENPKLIEFFSSLLGGNALLFQSINFLQGSEQRTHSDSIHMTTFPLGGLLGAWIALEDIDLENGPLHYYPGSHKLPYYLNADYDNEGTRYFLGEKNYSAYEDMIEQKIKEKRMKKLIFTAEKGDMIVWHANLFHGGEPQSDANRTRKSLVFHYFKENSICYHEVTQRPSLFNEK